MKIFHFDSIKKNLAALVVIGALPAVAILIYTGIEQRRISIEDARQDVFLLTQTMAEAQRDLARSTRQILSTLALMPQIRSLDIPASTRIFKAILDNNPEYHNLSLTAVSGEVLASGIPFAGVNLKDRKHFREALERKVFSIGEYVISRVGTPTPAFPFALPVLDKQGQVVAVLTAVIDLSSFSRIYDVSSMPEDSFLAVTDDRGIRIFYYPSREDTNPVGNPIRSIVWETARQAQKPGIYVGPGSDNLRRIVAFQPIYFGSDSTPYLYVWAGIPEAHILGSANTLLARNLLLMLLAVGLSLFVAWVIGRRIFIAPIEKLVAMTRRFAEGDFEFNSEPDGRPDEFLMLTNAFHDMAESLQASRESLQQSEEKSRLILNSAAEAIYGLDQFGHCTFCNQSCLDLLGYQSEQDLLGRPMHSLIHHTAKDGSSNSVEYCKIFESFRTGRKFHVDDEVLWKSDGTSFPAEYWSHPVLKEGSVIGAVVTFVDITERKQVEAERQKLESQLRQKFKLEAVGVMAGGVAHNFNNNLSIILGNVELSLLNLPKSSDVVPLLKNVKTTVLRSRDLIQKILTYSRQGTMVKAVVKPSAIVSETMTLLRSTIPTSVTLQLKIDPDCHNVVIDADESQVQEVLVNLCSNAVHAMSEKGMLLISLERVDLKQEDIPVQFERVPGSYLRLSVKDTGCGMIAETLEKIFDPFFTTKDINVGSGMGLSTVRGIIEQHDGFIKVNSSLGEGTTFELYFPVSKAELLEFADKVQAIRGGHEKILFVDDEEMLLQLGEMMLSRAGYQVTATNSSRRALELIQAEPERFDLLITDQTMPEMSGQELIGRLREINPAMPTILCTGFSNQIDAEQAKELGVKLFMMKPLQRIELLQATRRVLDENNG